MTGYQQDDEGKSNGARTQLSGSGAKGLTDSCEKKYSYCEVGKKVLSQKMG
jgi:hypothetical protein